MKKLPHTSEKYIGTVQAALCHFDAKERDMAQSKSAAVRNARPRAAIKHAAVA